MAGDRPATRHVRLWGLHVADEPRYQRYRDAMTPLLHRHGGYFAYDVEVARVLASEAEQPPGREINRLFTIAFPDAATADRFFADPTYLAARREFFEPAVTAVTLIARFDEPAPA